jgi:hypothetical protein
MDAMMARVIVRLRIGQHSFLIVPHREGRIVRGPTPASASSDPRLRPVPAVAPPPRVALSMSRIATDFYCENRPNALRFPARHR